MYIIQIPRRLSFGSEKHGTIFTENLLRQLQRGIALLWLQVAHKAWLGQVPMDEMSINTEESNFMRTMLLPLHLRPKYKLALVRTQQMRRISK
jgi:hypothetical protein